MAVAPLKMGSILIKGCQTLGPPSRGPSRSKSLYPIHHRRQRSPSSQVRNYPALVFCCLHHPTFARYHPRPEPGLRHPRAADFRPLPHPGVRQLEQGRLRTGFYAPERETGHRSCSTGYEAEPKDSLVGRVALPKIIHDTDSQQQVHHRSEKLIKLRRWEKSRR